MNLLPPLKRLFLVQLTCLAITTYSLARAADTVAAAPAAEGHHGAIGIGTWNTAAEFKDIVVTSESGEVLYRSDIGDEATNSCFLMDGAWSFQDGVFRQSAIRNDCRLFLGGVDWKNYTVTLRARKTAGQEGFFLYVNCLDRDNWTWFNVGGWTNSLSSIDQHLKDRLVTLCERVPQTVETGIWYDVGIVLKGPRIECYLNGNLAQTATYSNTSPAAALASISPLPPEKKASLRGFLNPTFRGAVGVGTWNTAAEFRDIVVTSNGVVLYTSDFQTENLDDWRLIGGSWTITNGVLRQTEYDLGCFANIGDTNWSNYTLTVKARKLSGAEGFCAMVGTFGDNNRVWLNAGSWGNRSVEIYQDTLGRRGTLTERMPLSIETGKWYEIRMVVEGARVSCYLDSNLVHSAIANVLISTNATYAGAMPAAGGNLLRFKIGKAEFRGWLPSDRGGPPALEPGSLVEVTGTVQPGAGLDYDLQINSPVDVVLLQRPSWWTWRRIAVFGGTLLGVLTAGAIWIAMISRRNRLLTIAQRQLETANNELEHRVRERTADLAKANAELEHEQALFRTLLETASDSIYFKDTKSRFIRCSLSACRRMGRSHEEIVGKTDFDLFREEHAREAFENEQKIIQTGRPLVGKLEKEIHPDGRTTWVMTTKMPWRSPDGKIIGTFGISHDITSIKEAEAELERAQNQLIDASRAAGMAEVATGVLHNVGNVLNSVNVATSLLMERLRQSKVKSVGRIAALLTEHAEDLGQFITNDPHGRHLTPFLSNLAEVLEREQVEALEELAGLQRNVEHIKEIIVMQQSYATISGVVTIAPVADLLADALRLTESDLTRHGVTLVKDFDPELPEIAVDRHKVLQILVNLIRNAKQACDDSQATDKQVTFHAALNGGQIAISVKDNGVGIPAENLTSIFRHGFTTRKNGHGFGLHSSAIAAKELGGELRVQSDGSGRGATFTLLLNFDRTANSAGHNSTEKPSAMAQGSQKRQRTAALQDAGATLQTN